MRPTQKAAVALIAGAIIHAVGGIVGQIVQASTQVGDDMFSYPWTSAELVAVSLVEALAFGLGLVGLAALRASGVAGATRAARVGLGVALAGTALFVVAELVSIAVRDQYRDEGAAGALGGVFGLATLLLGAGLATAGVAARRAGRWEGWRPSALLACGLSTLAMLGIVLTPAMPLGVTVMGLLQAAIGAGLLTRPTPLPPRPSPPAPPPRSRCADRDAARRAGGWARRGAHVRRNRRCDRGGDRPSCVGMSPNPEMTRWLNGGR